MMSVPTITIRRGTREDVAAVSGLFLELMAFHEDLDARFAPGRTARAAFENHLLGSILRSQSAVLFVAERDGALVGFLTARIEYAGPIYRHGDHGFISDAYVGEEHRRHGVGRRLAEAAGAWFRRRGVAHVRVSVATCNDTARTFWRDMGFRPFMERLWLDLDPETMPPADGD